MVDVARPVVPSRSSAHQLFLRLSQAVGFASAAFVLVWLSTWIAGFGRDFHWLRATPSFGILVLAGFQAIHRQATGWVRLLAIGLGLITAIGIWWGVPCRPGGPSLIAAVNQRASLRQQMADRGVNAIGYTRSLHEGIISLASDYPDLTAELRFEVERWSEDILAVLLTQFNELPSDDLRQLLSLQTQVTQFTNQFPQFRPAITTAIQNWLARSLSARVTELNQLRPGDWAGFQSTSLARRSLATSFPEFKAPLVQAEAEVVRQWVELLAMPSAAAGLQTPTELRNQCRAILNQVLTLKSLDSTSGRFRAAREALFRTAQQCAEQEVHAHRAVKRYDLAFGVASGHWLDWLPTARLLGPLESKQLNDLRESTRAEYLKYGESPHIAPLPRGRELAPTPRPSQLKD